MTSVEELRDQLGTLCERAREAGEHQVAYHALAGVLHACESVRDMDGLERVEARAHEYSRWLGQSAPTHPLSPQSAALRGHHGLFEQLAATALAARTRIKAEKLTGKQKGRT